MTSQVSERSNIKRQKCPALRSYVNKPIYVIVRIGTFGNPLNYGLRFNIDLTKYVMSCLTKLVTSSRYLIPYK